MICDSSFRKKVFLKLVCNFAMICDTPWVGQKRVICPALHKGPFHSRRIRPTIFDPWTSSLPRAALQAFPVQISERCSSCRRKFFVIFSRKSGLDWSAGPDAATLDKSRIAFLKEFLNFPNNSIGQQPILQLLINLKGSPSFAEVHRA